MTTRKAVEMASHIENGDQWKPERDATSDTRGTRPDGSGAMSPRNRKSRSGSGEVPSRQLDIRSR